MIAGAGVTAVPDAHLLLAMRGAHARIHIKRDAFRRTMTMNDIDPPAGKISKRGKVPFRREPACLEAAHLARRSRATLRCLAADNPAHCGIMAHVFISGETTKH